MNFSGMDLNLLVALDALLSTESVTKAARQTGVTQPAMSNALRRLRDTVGNPILVKHGRRLVPTSWAVTLRPVLGRALRDLGAVLSEDPAFDPAKARATMTLAVSDYWQSALLPRLFERINSEAPGFRLDITPVTERVLIHDLPSGHADVAIYLSPRGYPGLQCETFVTDKYVCVMRKGHPIKRGGLSLERYASYRHVVVAPPGPWVERLGEAMRRHALSPELALVTSHVHVALDIVSRTDFIAVVPSRIAQQFGQARRIKVMPPPVPLGEFSLGVYWHERTVSSPPHVWFRALLLEQARRAYFERAP